VVRDGETGFLLPEVSPIAIASALRSATSNPQLLSQFAGALRATGAQGIDALAAGLIELENA